MATCQPSKSGPMIELPDPEPMIDEIEMAHAMTLAAPAPSRGRGRPVLRLALAPCSDSRRCSSAPCVTTQPTRRCRATSCSCARGYIRRVAPGIYSWLPLGLAVLGNVERIVREEMTAIGAQEVHFPALIPREIFEASGRWADYGDGLFRLQDRKGADYLLGADPRGAVHAAGEG